MCIMNMTNTLDNHQKRICRKGNDEMGRDSAEKYITFKTDKSEVITKRKLKYDKF